MDLIMTTKNMNNTVDVGAVPKAPNTPEWLFWAALALIAVAPTQFAYSLDPKHGPHVAYADVIAGVVVVLWVIWRLCNGFRGLHWPPAAIAGLLITGVLSAGFAESKMKVAVELAQIVLYFLAVYVVFADVLQTKARVRNALIALAVPTCANVVVAMWQYAGGSEAFGVGGLLSNRNVYSAYLAMVLPVWFGLTLGASSLRWRLIGIVGTLAAMVTILSPPIFWVTAVILTAMAIATRPDSRVFAVAGVLGAVCLALVLPVNNAAVIGELADLREKGPIYKLAEDTDATDTAAEDQFILAKRWLEWKPAVNMMVDNFMLGVGAGNFQLNIGRTDYYGFLPNVKKSEPDTNNLYLVIGCTMGFAGLICLVAYLGYFWTRVRTCAQEAPEGWQRNLSTGLMGSVVAIAATNLFTSLFVRGTGIPWVMIFALIAVMDSGVLYKNHRNVSAQSGGEG